MRLRRLLIALTPLALLPLWLLVARGESAAAPSTTPSSAPSTTTAPAPEPFTPSSHGPGFTVAEVAEVLSTKCAQCHGEHATRIRAGFGIVDNLPKLVKSDYVIPGHPAKSDLWAVIKSGEMPPSSSKNGVLSAQQKQLVFDWIAAGAPLNDGKAPSSAAATSGTPAADTPEPAPSLLVRLLALAGRMHVLVIHFPIALLLVAGVLEARALLKRRPADPTAILCLRLGAVASVVAAALGWLHASMTAYHGETLEWHRWLGVATALLALAAAAATFRPLTGKWTRPLIFLAALLVGPAAHLGGTLVYGPNFLLP